MRALADWLGDRAWAQMIWLMRRRWMRRLQEASVRWLPEKRQARARANIVRQNRLARRHGRRLMSFVVLLLMWSVTLTVAWRVSLSLVDSGVLGLER